VQTLYELLGALPDDDADRLRAAFRNAAKVNHPDNNPGDPDAPERFRRVVRAYVILRDERQRVTYNSLLAEADQHRALSSRKISRIHNFVPDAITATVIAAVSIGLFVLFERVLTISNVPAQTQHVTAQVSALTAAMPTTQRSDTVGRAGERNKLDQVPVSGEPAATEVVEEAQARGALIMAESSDEIPPIARVEVKDARYYLQRGHLAYRSGDLALAIVDFDLAIDLDPDFSDAYIDRAIVFRRMGDLKHAFADIAQAKRIDDLKLQQAKSPSDNK
jgi:curved DNA-binding protein CbpA